MPRAQRRYTPRRPTALPDGDASVLRRRFRQLELRLALGGERTRAAAELLRRDAAKVDGPVERLALAERIYLGLFPHLPQEYGRRSEVVQ